jgi:hypothetical protein
VFYVECCTQRLTGKTVARVRRELSGRGFALVDTPRFFDDETFRPPGAGTTAFCFDHTLSRKFPSLSRYGRWLAQLLARALPDELVPLVLLEYRREPAGYTDSDVDRLHVDGAYLRAVYSLSGRATIYRDGNKERSVPDGQTLVMTAMDRTRATRVHSTLHRRPDAGAARELIVCSFRPRPEKPRAASA